MSDLSHLLSEAHDMLPAAIDLRRRIHAKPELGLDLPLTTQAVLDGIEGLDVQIERGTSTSGLIVSLMGTRAGSQSGRTILLRGDMDALPMPEETGLDFSAGEPGVRPAGHRTVAGASVPLLWGHSVPGEKLPLRQSTCGWRARACAMPCKDHQAHFRRTM